MAALAPKNTTSAALASLADALAILAGEEPGKGDGEGGAQPADDAAPGTGDPNAGDSDEEGEGEGAGIPRDSLGGERDIRGKAKAGFGSGSHKKSRLSEEIKAIIRDDTPETDPKPTKGSPAPIGLDICPDYKIYSTTGDLVVKAEDLISATKRTRLRDELDSLMSDSSLVSRLATKLMRHIMAQQTRAWQFDQEDGLLDPARLVRLISAPMLPAAYKTETIGKFKETTVTLLVDNSGSMAGTKIQIAAVVADTLARVMERCAVPVEVLGFTSKGYASLRDVTLGVGAGIGRFSCLRHIIYKAATVPYRRVRENFAIMLHEEILSQNVDGEALTWAHNRLVTRSQPRKILIMISDGAPAAEYDNGARSHGRERGLVHHLRAVIGEIEKHGEVELLAIGLGHDVTTWFKHGVTLHDMKDVGPALLTELGRMFEPKRPGR